MAEHDVTPSEAVGSVVGFCRALRQAGVRVPVSNSESYVQALSLVSVERTPDVYWAGRATLVQRHEDIDAFDRVFAAFWLGQTDLALTTARPSALVDLDDGDGTDPEDNDTERSLQLVRYSRAEILRNKDFARCTPAELAEAIEAMRTSWLHSEERLTHRWRRARRGTQLDLRCTARGAMRRGGELVVLEHQLRTRRPRRVVLLCDVSGSMEPYARALLRFAHVLVAGRSRVEAFALGTRLTRLTRELTSRDPDAALAAAGHLVQDWSGGTRLGDGIAQFNQRFGSAGMARGANVVVLSDGWDRGDPEELRVQMERLSRLAHQIVWVNPLKATPHYEPLARGMAAALPFVDHFLPGHNVASLEQLLEILAISGSAKGVSR
jgi:uncharacterized protein